MTENYRLDLNELWYSVVTRSVLGLVMAGTIFFAACVWWTDPFVWGADPKSVYALFAIVIPAVLLILDGVFYSTIVEFTASLALVAGGFAAVGLFAWDKAPGISILVTFFAIVALGGASLFGEAYARSMDRMVRNVILILWVQTMVVFGIVLVTLNLSF